tara:strand:+ start:69 stop:371 length:303 start_codon:yes stop_codon:yes gene_type:complete
MIWVFASGAMLNRRVRITGHQKLFYGVLLASLFVGSPGWSQEATEAKNSSTNSVGADADLGNPYPEEQGNEETVEPQSIMEYEPIESISEDLPVSFPVDI